LIMESSKHSKLLSVNKTTFHSISLSNNIIRGKPFMTYPTAYSWSNFFPASLLVLHRMWPTHLFCVHKVAPPDSTPPLVSTTVHMFPHYASLIDVITCWSPIRMQKLLPNLSWMGHGPQLCGMCTAYVWQWNYFKSTIMEHFRLSQRSVWRKLCVKMWRRAVW